MYKDMNMQKGIHMTHPAKKEKGTQHPQGERDTTATRGMD
jgi:hypothetical protein